MPISKRNLSPTNNNMKVEYAFIDLFCGCGGTTSGIENIPNAIVFACVNHDENAINSHKSNHPSALHFTEDIRTVSIQVLVEKAHEIRRMYPGVKICLWASLECTNHSNAKGGMSRDADSRTLAEHLFRYFVIDFDLIFIENVREFKQWGPLIQKINPETKRRIFDKKGTPIMVPDPKHKGRDYKAWVENVKACGYKFEDTLINCADLGCPTKRKRLFIQFAKPQYDIVWPSPTHSETGKDGLLKWNPVRPLLNLEEHGKSIFESRVRSPKTYARILKGVKKFGVPQFLHMYYGNGGTDSSLDTPSPTLTVKDRCYLTSFIASEYSTGRNSSLDSPAPTLTTVPKEKLITTHFLMDHQFGNQGDSLDEPCPTLIARQDKKPKYLVSTQFLMSTQFNNVGSSLDGPAPTQMASRKYDYLVTPDSKGINKAVINEGDSPELIELKMYMQDHGICDIRMRPLYIVEMLRIMTFREDYRLIGTQTEQKKYIGNAVPPEAAEKIVQTSLLKNAA